MKATSRIHFQWSPVFSLESFRVGVSLHSHTLHSREPLDFLYRVANHSWLLRKLLHRAERQYEAFHGSPLDLSRGWWTPPLAPLDAYNVEFGQIKALGLSPLVSLTDHDNIEAPSSLQAIDATRKVPISIEWTVPIRNTFFHIGVHNLPPLRARSIVSRMQEFTGKPNTAVLKEILAGLHASPGTLIVLNHPLWDEKGVGDDAHRSALLDLLNQGREYIHAVELNGLRPWAENRQATRLGETWSKPVISGGDRHALEPNVMLNLTTTANFAEFATQIRSGYSDVLIGSRYREGYAARIVQNVIDVLSTCENHGLGWKEWPDRVFYMFDDGEVKSLAQSWGNRPPMAIAAFTGCMRLAGRAPVRQALRTAAWRTGQVAL
ncbi:MAG: hypothetical protein LAO55_09120 [Acidobacteriia bacterium]|nr:hypothetical protein [Terriglobia bacterium]